MKKFCNKLVKQQWRITVPNINTALFRKSPDKENHGSPDRSPMKHSSGSYDLQKAEEEFGNNRRDVAAFAVDLESSDSDNDRYEDAREMSERPSSVSDLEMSMCVDLQTSQISEVTKVIGDYKSDYEKYEYDVPKISFSFFERQDQHDYQVVNAQAKHRLEENRVLESESETKPTHKSAIKIILSSPKSEQANDSNCLKISKSENELCDSLHEFVSANKCLSKSAENFAAFPVIKSGSDPNIYHSQKTIDKEDDGLYKVPKHRYAQSLDDFNMEDIEVVSLTNASIEHISCSQVLGGDEADAHVYDMESPRNSATMDYCKARSKIAQNKRKITLLRKPKGAVWINFKSKLNNLMVEQAAKQRVGAFSEKERSVITIEDFYKNSKDRCKKIMKIKDKFYAKPRNNQVKIDKSKTSRLVKNDDFFAEPSKGADASAAEDKMSVSDNEKDVCGASVNSETPDKSDNKPVGFGIKTIFGLSKSFDEDRREDLDFGTFKNAFRRSKSVPEGQTGFDDLRRYVKQGGDFCKELATILHERSEAELQYAKSLSKLSGKLARACREGIGGLNDAWRSVALELEARAEAHRVIGTSLLEDTARPLRVLTENQQKIRKHVETVVDKASKGLSDWRAAEAKSKKHSHACARDNEKLQDALLDARLSKNTSLIQLAHMHNQKALSEKENTKLEGKKRKAEDAVKKADIEYYTLCVRAERARLEWESAVSRGSGTFQTLEEERLNNLKSILTSYLHHNFELGPRLIEVTERLAGPVEQAEPFKDLSTFVSVRNSSQQVSEQLLPDFYCEHITLAMNRERRKQALVKLLQLIRQDIERERKSKNGLENLSKAMKQTPNFGAEESQYNVSEKLYHMKSMLTYLEGARYKVQSALAELDSRPRVGHPLGPHITITRDKSGLQQSILKVPQWLREEWVEPETSPLSEKLPRSEHISDIDFSEPDWTDRGTADGTSNQPDSDFDEFSSQGSSSVGLGNTEESSVQPIAQCKALYAYTPNLPDELTLHPGDVLSVYKKQDDGWWLGECNGSVGIFPATYVETLPL